MGSRAILRDVPPITSLIRRLLDTPAHRQKSPFHYGLQLARRFPHLAAATVVVNHVIAPDISVIRGGAEEGLASWQSGQ